MARAKPIKQSAQPQQDDENRYSFIENLQKTIDEQSTQLTEQQTALDKAIEMRDRSDQKLFEQRLVNQKLIQEVKQLRHQLEKEKNDSSVV